MGILSVDDGDRPEELDPQHDGLSGRYFAALEQTLKAAIDERAPRLPAGERSLASVSGPDGLPVGLIDRVRRYETREARGPDLWLIVDFDDVINNTTTFNAWLWRRISDLTGIPFGEVEKLYNNAKEPGPGGKKLFRFTAFVAAVKARTDRPEEVDALLGGIDYNAFVDQAVKRAIIAARMQHPLSGVRVSILTYGDPAYQRMRVAGTDLEDVVDDIVFTEGSKRAVLDALLAEYESGRIPAAWEGPGQARYAAPVLVTVDDSPEQVDDYAELHPLTQRGFSPSWSEAVNLRFHHPQAKRFALPHHGANVVSLDETHPRDAAVNVVKATRIAVSRWLGTNHHPPLSTLRDVGGYDGFLAGRAGMETEAAVRYVMDGDEVVRESMVGPQPPLQHGVRRRMGRIGADGALTDAEQPFHQLPYDEFIRAA